MLLHLLDIYNIIKRLYNLFNPDGNLANPDLYTKNGSVHCEDFTGRKGFYVEKVSKQIIAQSFTSIKYQQCFVINMKISGIEANEYDIYQRITEPNTKK
jgi:hypothetical protein